MRKAAALPVTASSRAAALTMTASSQATAQAVRIASQIIPAIMYAGMATQKGRYMRTFLLSLTETPMSVPPF